MAPYEIGAFAVGVFLLGGPTGASWVVSSATQRDAVSIHMVSVVGKQALMWLGDMWREGSTLWCLKKMENPSLRIVSSMVLLVVRTTLEGPLKITQDHSESPNGYEWGI